MTDAPGSSASPQPDDVLQQLFYVHDRGGVIGPILGAKLKEMVEHRAVARDASINLVGAPNWTPILQAKLFSDCFPKEAKPSQLRDGESGDLAYAGFWIRAAAAAIDYVLMLLLVTAIAAVFTTVGMILVGPEAVNEFVVANETAINIIVVMIALTYYSVFLSGPWQATPGKRICGIYVIRTDGQRIDGPFAALRYLSYMISEATLGVGFLMVFWTKERKALHDIVLGTRVVYGRKEAPSASPNKL